MKEVCHNFTATLNVVRNDTLFNGNREQLSSKEHASIVRALEIAAEHGPRCSIHIEGNARVTVWNFKTQQWNTFNSNSEKTDDHVIRGEYYCAMVADLLKKLFPAVEKKIYCDHF